MRDSASELREVVPGFLEAEVLLEKLLVGQPAVKLLVKENPLWKYTQ